MLALPMARLAVRTTHAGSMHRPRLAGPVRSSVVPGLGEVADRYDAVLLDQFGVLHDGKRSIAGAEDCYKRLAEAGKKLIVLSNTSRRRDFAVKRLPGLGFDPHALLGFVCSGEEAHAAMRESWRGRRVLWISWDDHCAPHPKRPRPRFLRVRCLRSHVQGSPSRAVVCAPQSTRGSRTIWTDSSSRSHRRRTRTLCSATARWCSATALRSLRRPAS